MMNGDCQYATVDEMREQLSAKHQFSRAPPPQPSPPPELELVPPPLPPPNPKTSQKSPPLCVRKTKAASEENVQTVDGLEGESSEPIHTSTSSPSLTSLGENVMTLPSDTVELEVVDGKIVQLYATVNKKKKSDSVSSTPPPLPPPLVLDPGVPLNGTAEDKSEDIMFIPATNDGKHRRPVPLPRSHVYEQVPDDIKNQQQPSFASTRKSSKKKKSSNGKDKIEDTSPTSPLISLSMLEPLPSTGESIRLCDFVNRFSNYLPLRVRVEEGYCGTEERFVISSGDVYNFHFVKNEKIVSIKDCGGTSFSIPLNSAIEFGLLYIPSNNFKEVLSGYTFKNISDLAASKTTPRLICATKTHLTSEPKSSVHADELLVIKKISRTAVMRKHVLKAFSLKTNEDKLLQEDCEGHFTTNPNSIKLYLPEILEHFGNDFPLEAMLYIRPETSDDLPLHLTSDIITLTHTEIESSIIASTCWEYEKQELSEEDRALVAIPTNLDIEVTFLGKESEDEQLYESTKSYFEKFSHLKITSMKNSGGMHRGAGPAQKKLYKVVREGFESSGTEIRMPYRISGVFEGEVSPLTKFMDNQHIYHTLVPQVGGGANPSPHIRTDTTTVEKETNNDYSKIISPRDQYLLDTPSDYLSPPTQPRSKGSSSNQTSNAQLHSSTLISNPNHCVFDTELDDLTTAMYSAIDDLLESTAETTPNNTDDFGSRHDNVETSLPTKKSSHDQDKLCKKTSDKLPASLPPKPLPRYKTLPEFTSQGDSQKSREVNDEGIVESRDSCSAERRKQGAGVLAVEELSKNYALLQLEVQQLKRDLYKAREAGYAVLPSERPTLVRTRSLPRRKRPVSILKANNKKEQEKNKEELRNLDHVEVITLLEAMNLGQYKEQFMKEQVDGEILAECDEVILENELRVSNTIHRTRLMKVVTGRHSALSFIQGDDLYSTLCHKI